MRSHVSLPLLPMVQQQMDKRQFYNSWFPQPECTCQRLGCVPKSVRGYGGTKRRGRPEESQFQAKAPQHMRKSKPEANNGDCSPQCVVSLYLLKKSDGTSHTTEVTKKRSVLLGHSMAATQNKPDNTDQIQGTHLFRFHKGISSKSPPSPRLLLGMIFEKARMRIIICLSHPSRDSFSLKGSLNYWKEHRL